MPKSKRQQVYERDNYRCVYCGEWGGPKHTDHLTLDHVLPSSRGGSNGMHNLVTACLRCNNMKGDRTPGEWVDADLGVVVGTLRRQGLTELASTAEGQIGQHDWPPSAIVPNGVASGRRP